MKLRASRSLILGVLAICVSTAVAAATISSPYRQRSESLIMKRAAPGEQWLDLDRAALAALRGSGAGPVEVMDFPTAPGATGRLALRRFEVASPDARIRVAGPKGDSFLAFPSIAHFSGRIEGEPDTVATFTDVPCSSPFAPWIYELAARNITGGCGGTNYCPDNTVTRKQMAPFLLKTLNGSAYVPPACTPGLFGDVLCPSLFADWIQRLYDLGITGGCQASPLLYCPDSPNTRGQMAVFLVKTFNLTW